MLGEELPFAKWEVWRSRCSCLGCVPSHLLVSTQNWTTTACCGGTDPAHINLTESWSWSQIIPPKCCCSKVQKSNAKPPNFHNFTGKHRTLVSFSSALLEAFTALWEDISKSFWRLQSGWTLPQNMSNRFLSLTQALRPITHCQYCLLKSMLVLRSLFWLEVLTLS